MKMGEPHRPMSDNTINAALRRLHERGVDRPWFRTMASTLLNEQGYPPDVIELQLAHRAKHGTRRVQQGSAAPRAPEDDAGAGGLSRRVTYRRKSHRDQEARVGSAMSTWRKEALRAVPQLHRLVESADSPMALWIELYLRFQDAVSAGDKQLERRILGYASWCRSDRSGPLPNDTSTAVICAFYENLARHKEFWPRFPEWFFHEEFAALVPAFSYLLKPAEVQDLQESYMRARPRQSPRPKPARKR
jgi:hypothetical protein